MSLTKTQIDSLARRNVKANTTSYLQADLTADINLAVDRFLSIAIPASGKWQLDDSNHTDYPIITTNLVASQRDYSFTGDENGNLILDIYKVMVKDPSGVYNEIKPVDQQSDSDVSSFWDGKESTGTPIRYDKTANGIFLDPVPSYNSTGGIKIFINREGSYFTTDDTTKKAGFDGRFHEYFALYPSYLYATRNNLLTREVFKRDLAEMEALIKYTYAGRERGVSRSIKPLIENCR